MLFNLFTLNITTRQKKILTIHWQPLSFSCDIFWTIHKKYPQDYENMGAIHSAKFRFEISKIPRAQWNGTFRLHRPAFGYCSCKQDSKELYWGQQFCQMERDISVRPTEMTRPVKVDHLKRWSQIFRSDRTETDRSI